MHQKIATLLLLLGMLLGSGCETWDPLTGGSTTAPPPSDYETAQPPIFQESESPGQPTSRPPANRPPRPERSRVASHRVVPGDSLWSLSRKYETTIAEIREANGLSGDVIKTGATLKIPTSMPEQMPPAPPVATNPTYTPSAPTSSTTSSNPWATPAPSTTTTSPPTSAPRYRIPEPVILPPPGSY